ncbi:MAG: aspartate-semialdehyde dehydrogenase [Phycisphaeraceae bacterium]|nr:aspartate-semialdehyde dehydrogenase [Phycisphaeraceae bacterium]
MPSSPARSEAPPLNPSHPPRPAPHGPRSADTRHPSRESAMTTTPNIAIVGATGAVGREMLTVLEQRQFPHAALTLLASERSAGVAIDYRAKPHTVEPLSERSFDSMRPGDIALFSAGSSISKKFGPIAADRGVVVIDNSSAFRMDPGVPLLVPEVNPDALGPGYRIIANPNCSAIILLVALTPLRRAFGIDRIVVSTYQAASGAGAKAMDELLSQSREALAGRPVLPGAHSGGVFHEPYAFNLFSHNAAVDPSTGLNGEEQKMVDESRKIWNDPALRLAPTCIRVPVLRAHAQAINLTLRTPTTETHLRDALARGAGVQIVDDRSNNLFPTPLKASGKDNVLVGRIRPDPTQDRGRGWDLFIAGDQLRKGAALNAVQIAEILLQRRAR